MMSQIFDMKTKYEENMFNVMSTVSADGLTTLGARPSAGTVMIKFRSNI